MKGCFLFKTKAWKTLVLVYMQYCRWFSIVVIAYLVQSHAKWRSYDTIYGRVLLIVPSF